MFFKMKIAEGITREYANIIHWDEVNHLFPEMKDDIIDMCNFYGELGVLKVTNDDYMNPYRIHFSTPLFIDDKGKVFIDKRDQIIPLINFNINNTNFKEYINILYNMTLESHLYQGNDPKPVKMENQIFTSETINAYNKRHFTTLEIMKIKVKDEDTPLHDERYNNFLKTVKSYNILDVEFSIRYHLSKYYFENVSGKLTDTPQEYFDWLNKNLE